MFVFVLVVLVCASCACCSAVHHAAEYGHVAPVKAMQQLYGADLDVDAEDAVGWYVSSVKQGFSLHSMSTLTTDSDFSGFS